MLLYCKIYAYNALQNTYLEVYYDHWDTSQWYDACFQEYYSLTAEKKGLPTWKTCRFLRGFLISCLSLLWGFSFIIES